MHHNYYRFGCRCLHRETNSTLAVLLFKRRVSGQESCFWTFGRDTFTSDNPALCLFRRVTHLTGCVPACLRIPQAD